MNKSADLAMMLKRVIRMGRRVGISDVPFTSLLDSADSLLDRTGMQGSPLRPSPPPVASVELSDTHEVYISMLEGAMNVASDGYFEVRKDADTKLHRLYFDEGFRRGYDHQLITIALRDARIAELDADLSAAREESK
jgi:hypothetical protein